MVVVAVQGASKSLYLGLVVGATGGERSEPPHVIMVEFGASATITSRLYETVRRAKLFRSSVCGIRIPRTLVRRMCFCLPGRHIQLTERTDERWPRSTSTGNAFVYRLHDVPWDTISHHIFVLRHHAAPQHILLQISHTLDDILVISLRHLIAALSDLQGTRAASGA